MALAPSTSKGPAPSGLLRSRRTCARWAALLVLLALAGCSEGANDNDDDDDEPAVDACTSYELKLNF